jgi:hypothetical protein
MAKCPTVQALGSSMEVICGKFFQLLSSSVMVLDPDPYVMNLQDPDPLVRGTDPDPSIIKQK